MQQYQQLLRDILEKGVNKPPARERMPGSRSLFGYQFRHNLGEGFPLLTTKEMYWKGVVVELLWFLRGDTNIKFLVDNGVNIWNEDAYNYYKKVCKEPMDFETFLYMIKEGNLKAQIKDYKLGDCGFQYGKVWRKWQSIEGFEYEGDYLARDNEIDQIDNLIKGLKTNPEGRRHIVTSIDPAHDQELALYWCHAMFQFNCRPLSFEERFQYWFHNNKPNRDVVDEFDEGNLQDRINYLNLANVPKYYLDCQLYQRSADAVLGVPFNIASYALLTHIVARICNMIPGEFIHTFGDVHIYDNHMEAVQEQLTREPRKLPNVLFHNEIVWENYGEWDFDVIEPWEISIENYNPHPKIKAKLSTGLK